MREVDNENNTQVTEVDTRSLRCVSFLCLSSHIALRYLYAALWDVVHNKSSVWLHDIDH